MADFFTRLAERTLGTVPVAQPLLTPLFATPVTAQMPVNDIELVTYNEGTVSNVQEAIRPTRPAAQPIVSSSHTNISSLPPTMLTMPTVTDVPEEVLQNGLLHSTPVVEREKMLSEERVSDEYDEHTVQEQTIQPTTREISMPLVQTYFFEDNAVSPQSPVPPDVVKLDALSLPLPSPGEAQLLQTNTPTAQDWMPSQETLQPVSMVVPLVADFEPRQHEESIEISAMSAAQLPSMQYIRAVQPLIAAYAGETLSDTPAHPTTESTHEESTEAVTPLEANEILHPARSSYHLSSHDIDPLVAQEHITHIFDEVVLEQQHLVTRAEGLQHVQASITDAIDEAQQHPLPDFRKSGDEVSVPQERNSQRPNTRTFKEPIEATSHQVVPGQVGPSRFAQREHVVEPEPVVQQPTIHISIGRIDVRAVTQSAPSARPKPTRAAPTLSLEDYLKQQRGGRS